ncbi:MAG TPA: ABC transporter substrate-binding protein [Burkholderiales bacterium]|nr:ABC transporter substrate-binding protein [Burkholderiales bacterium]
MFPRLSHLSRCLVLLVACGLAFPLKAEVSEIRISKQYGLPYLTVVIVEQQRLIEKHTRLMGLGDVKVSWLTIGSGGTSTDSLLAGNLDFVTSGISNMLLLWSRTGEQVKAVGAVAAVPLLLVTRNPNVKTIADFTEKDKIAVPTVKVSMQSTILGIAAQKIYGEAGRGKFDPLTVAMSAPDAAVALLSGAGEVNSHFSVPPYQNVELKSPGIHTVLDSTDVMGGPATITVIFGMTKFHDANPKTIAAIMAALREASDFIARDKRGAADMYLKATKDKISLDELTAMLESPGYRFTQAPNGTLKYAEQMFKTGVIKTQPASWKDAFFPIAHGLPGN